MCAFLKRCHQFSLLDADNWPRDALPKGTALHGWHIDGVIIGENLWVCSLASKKPLRERPAKIDVLGIRKKIRS
jgi:hypothetical protein